MSGIRVLLLFAWFSTFPQPALSELLIAAASSIRTPLDNLISSYQNHSGKAVKISYGSSGSLTHQILRGAPYQIFLSADYGFPQKLRDQGLGQGPPVVYAIGGIDLYAPNGSACLPERGLKGLAEGVRAGAVRHIGIANPDLAPYGRAAKQALEHANTWQAVIQRLVYANNVAQVAQFALSGAVDCALVSHSHAITDTFSRAGSANPVPPNTYSPIRHAMLLLDGANEEAADLFAYLQTPHAAGLFAEAGFDIHRE